MHRSLSPLLLLVTALGCRGPTSASGTTISCGNHFLVASQSVWDARPRCCLSSANRTQFRLFGRCKAVPHPLQRMPEKHLARQGIFRSLCGLKTVLGVVLAQLDL